MNPLFQQQVWEITKLIPKGRVSSYGAIAKAVGFPNYSRHVGKAMCGCPKEVPTAIARKAELLHSEGVEFKIGIYTGSFNAKMMKIKLNQQTLPTRYDDKIYYFDATPLYAEFDSNDNLISIMLSYTETYVAFNQFGNPMAPAEITLKTELFFGPKLLPFKNAISKKDWNDNLVNMITPELKNNI